MFLSTPADIAFFGGAAGGGKTMALLLEPLRHIRVRRFGAVIFRREYPQIKAQGGLWDESRELYPAIGALARESMSDWTFPSGARIRFAHMQLEDDRFAWDGSQIPMIGFDQLESFSWKQFSYMLSRNRSTCGVDPYIRATCNPDPDHWLRTFIAWWIDDETGLAIKKRSGVIRWFVNLENEIHWGATREELLDRFGEDCDPKSFTFIHSSVYDNKILLDRNPSYLANLKALQKVDRERLLYGNWNARETAGMFFQRDWFEIVEAAPANCTAIRYWDRAATDPEIAAKKPKGSFTVGLKMIRDQRGVFYVTDVDRFQGSPLTVQTRVKNVATQDGVKVTVGIEQDPGQAGKAEAEFQVRNLAGYNVVINAVHEAKSIRVKPYSSQCEVGNVKLLKGAWNESYLRELQNFDGSDGCASDQVDTSSGAFLILAGVAPYSAATGGPREIVSDLNRIDREYETLSDTLSRF